MCYVWVIICSPSLVLAEQMINTDKDIVDFFLLRFDTTNMDVRISTTMDIRELLILTTSVWYDDVITCHTSTWQWEDSRIGTTTRPIPALMVARLYVMWSREISLKSNMWHFQLSIWLKWLFGEVHFAENPNQCSRLTLLIRGTTTRYAWVCISTKNSG